jgi:hypothetical protein
MTRNGHQHQLFDYFVGGGAQVSAALDPERPHMRRVYCRFTGSTPVLP